MKHTALNAKHRSLGARMVEFGGWEMPVHYEGGIVAEHEAVRKHAGLFDLQHMGRLRLTGKDRAAFLDRVVTQAVATAKPGMARYSIVVNEEGNALDDIIFYTLPESIVVVVNAGNRERIVEHFRKHLRGDVVMEDLTERWAMLAVQGPEALAIVQGLCDLDVTEMKYYKCAGCMVAGEPTFLATTGYTGEHGFELVFDARSAERMWDLLLLHGASRGLKPCGLGSRDTLRLEAGMPLYGHELELDVNPFEAGLDFAVSGAKEFIGSQALARIKKDGAARKLLGFVVDGKRIPRQGAPLLAGGEVVGKVTSGTSSPTVGKVVCMGFVPARLAQDAATTFEVEISGKRYPLARAELPFYSNTRKKK
ncbi:MAG TPA: glycine cleavage system aminomethyltransferase GcvT [Planctomycetota bacterium]|nr:glycine cleavage system aminomethyltransferase GcvT [Planctomycetota bacterium]